MKALLGEKSGLLGRIGFALIGIAVAVTCASLQASAAVHHGTSFVVDGVHVTISGGEVRGTVFSGLPGDATQETTIVDRTYHRIVSVIAVPFGTRPGTEDLPIAQRGGARDYREALHAFRSRNGEYATDAPTMTMFGSRVAGDLSLRTEHETVASGLDVDREVFTLEWVTEAGPRLWIVRARQFAVANHPLATVADFIGTMAGLTLSANGPLNAPTTISPDVSESAVPLMTLAPSREPQLGVPPAYSNACDADNYDKATGRRDWRNQLGGSYRGVPACGPRPGSGAPLTAAAFTPGAPPAVFQFDATELSMRWMFLAYNTPPFTSNGDDLFENYLAQSGGQALYRYANVRRSSAPQPGDVLSYDTGGTLGHTSVVDSAHVDGHGNGWIEVIEQGESEHGFARLNVIDGQVFSNYGGYIRGWLSPRPPRE